MISRTMMMLLPLIGGLMLQDVAILVKSFPTPPLSRMKPQQSSSSSATPLAPLRPLSSQLAMRSMSVVLGKQEQQQIPKLGKNGLYLITNEEEYRTLLNHNADKLIVLKVFAPWCKTCKALEPKFQALARGLSGCGTTGATNGAAVALPIIWAELPHSKRNKDFVKSVIGVSALPSVQLYAGNGMKVDTFPCGPSKVSTILKPKLSQLILEHVDMPTKQLKVIVTKNKQGENISVNNKDIARLHHFQHPLRFWTSIYNMIRLKLRTIFIVYQYRRRDDAITSF